MKFSYFFYPIVSFFVIICFFTACQPPVLSNMILIEGGTFTMGSPSNEENDEEDERPAHKVIVSDFYISKYEVSVGEYLNYLKSTNKNYSEWLTANALTDSLSAVEIQLPAVAVSWNDAVAYCKWLSGKTGLSYRLPTEAEFEYAASAGGTNKWAGTNIEHEVEEYGWFSTNSEKSTHPRRLKKPNVYDLYDMSGNVWEWCSDYYDYYNDKEVLNPKGPSEGKLRVYKGGAWTSCTCDSRAASRSYGTPDFKAIYLGFRLAANVRKASFIH